MDTNLLSVLHDQIPKCTACSIRPEAIAPVPFEGSNKSSIMFVGRNPGNTEDKVGKPFVGPGGQLLDQWIERAFLVRDHVFITNLAKCYTSHDREPEQEEIDICSSLWLSEEVKAFQPKIIIPLGKQAMHYFVPGIKVSTYQGVWYPTRAATLFYIHHPGYILRGGFPRDAWLELADKFRYQSSVYL